MQQDNTAARHHSLRIVSELKTKGQRYNAEQLFLRPSGRPLGEGSFGEVFEGTLKGSKGEQHVILKRVKDKVQGAVEMQEMEHLLNVYASKAARHSVADFLGFCEVDTPVNRLTRGLWLVWAYQGSKTLAYYLKRRDCLEALARDMRVPEGAVVPTIMRHIFVCLEDIHGAGLVHRDIKPSNLIFCERDLRFKLIDLGAACDLRSGTNYRPTETILDPCYCPPEEYVLPTDAPHLSQHAQPFAMAMSPLLWSQHRPDCFDTYSAGIILMQLALPSLRTLAALRTFRQSLARSGHDLEEWRVRAVLPARDTVVLDENDGEGWDLAEGLLRAREVENDGEGNVKFVNRGGPPRLTAAAALRHTFVKRAAAPAGSPAAWALSPLASLFAGISGNSGGGSSAEEPDDLIPGGAPAAASAGGGGWLGGWGRPSGSGSRGSTSGNGGSSGSSATGSRGDKQAQQRQRTQQARQRAQQAAQRPAAPAAKPAARPASAAAAPPPKRASLWQRIAGQLYDLEARVRAESSATEVQTTLVQKLRQDVAAGRAREEQLQQEEGALAVMQHALQDSMKDLRNLYKGAARFLGKAPEPPAAAPQQAKQPATQGTPPAAKQAPTQLAAGAPAAAEKAQAERAGPAAMPANAAPAAAPAVAARAAVPAKPGEKGGGGWGQAAGSMVSAGLKFTGLAVHVATSLAEAVRSDAEKALKQAQQEASTLRHATSAYVEALQQLQPPVAATTSYEAVAARLPAAEAYSSLPEPRRRQAFAAYVDGLRRAERAARERAMSDFGELLGQANLPPGLDYAGFVALHGTDPRFLAVGEASAREAAFSAHMDGRRSRQVAAERQAQREAEERERAVLAEAGFRLLLAGQEAAIKAGATWAQVKRNMWADPRFDAVVEPRRRELFTQYCNLLAEAGELAGGARQAQAPAVGAGEAPPAPAEDAVQLDRLREEQAKLKEEYDRLEAKLKEMEQQFKQTLPVGAVAAVDEVHQQRAVPVNGVAVNGVGRK
ncbi:hypothetical protein N2152v2_004972 [Parachlorella kessleri]